MLKSDIIKAVATAAAAVSVGNIVGCNFVEEQIAIKMNHIPSAYAIKL